MANNRARQDTTLRPRTLKIAPDELEAIQRVAIGAGGRLMQHTEKPSAQSGKPVITTAPSRTQFGELLTIRQVAEYLGCSETTVRNRIKEGSLKAVRMGPRMIRIRRDDLDEILQPYDAGQAGSWSHLR